MLASPMNQLDLEEILQKARKRRLDEHQGAWLKTFIALADFEYRGQRYLTGEEYELDEGGAKELASTNRVQIVQGGVCDVSQVRRVGKEMLFAYRSWRFDPPVAVKDPFADVMVRVRLNKSIQAVVGVLIRPGTEFFLPYSEVRQFDFGLESAPDNYMHPIDILADQE